ncbi:MAG: hypothetical protein D6742_07640 [Cyanobacteria bacterium J069]|nr:MAG: hypothetical protein D6742_07640 [Cyanobacteria bacterium J069]
MAKALDLPPVPASVVEQPLLLVPEMIPKSTGTQPFVQNQGFDLWDRGLINFGSSFADVACER